MNRIRIAAAVAVLAVVAACGGDDPATPATASTTAATGDANPYGAQVASYDLSTDGPQRFIVGLLGDDGGLIVGGEVNLEFRFFGADATETADTAEGDLRLQDIPATFTAVGAGIAAPDGPRLRAGDEGVGIYEANDIVFDEAGFWSVTVHADIDGEEVSLSAAFEVADDNAIVNAGDPAPQTVNALPGSATTAPQAIDSRAEADGTIPDPELHTLTVADAIASGKPTIVVVSTPVFCVSRFCGPITDSIQTIAGRVGDAANFIHLEVWRDFEANTLNASAAEWIYPQPDTDAAEPWVFLVDGAGTVVRRWDNVANEGDVEAALRELTG